MYFGRGKVRAHTNTGIATNACILIPEDPALLKHECARGASLNADSAGDAGALRFGIVAVGAGNVAALQKDRSTTSWTIDQGERNDLIYGSSASHSTYAKIGIPMRTLRSPSAFARQLPSPSWLVSAKTASPCANFSISERLTKKPVMRTRSESLV